MLTKFKKYLEPVLFIIAQPFLSINPNILTGVSVIFALLFAISLSKHMYALAAISWIGIIFDALDGYVARKTNKVTKFGAFFDSTMDRISDFFYVSAFGFAGLVPWTGVSFAIVTTFLVSYTKARGESLLPGSKIVNGITQRTERLLLLFLCFALFALGFNNVGLVFFVLLIILNGTTVIQRILKAKELLNG